MNVADVYLDDRFNKAIDDQTGYSSKSILCMPIQIRGQVIGVIQMVNKVAGSFSDVSAAVTLVDKRFLNAIYFLHMSTNAYCRHEF